MIDHLPTSEEKVPELEQITSGEDDDILDIMYVAASSSSEKGDDIPDRLGEEETNILMVEEQVKPTITPSSYKVDIPESSPIQKQLEELNEEYKDLFDERLPAEGSKLDPFPIPQKERTVVKHKARFLNGAVREVVKAKVEEYLDQGVVKLASAESFASPIVVVRKNGKLRVCVDYRELNKTVEPFEYPMPRTKEILQTAANKRFYAKMDLRDAYHQMLVVSGDRFKTGWITPDYHVESNRLDFGHTDGPKWFQYAMEKAFKPLLDKQAGCIFIDDITVWGDTEGNFLANLREALNICRAYNLRLKASKCSWGTTSIEVVGYILDRQGRRFSERRLDAIRSMAQPTNMHELYVFLGAANTYRDFVKDYGKMVAPLQELLKKNREYNFTDEHVRAFEAIKSNMVSGIVLAEGTEPGELILRTDASAKGVGGLLVIKDETGEHPVCFFSKAFNTTQQAWSTYEQELYAILYCITSSSYAALLRSHTFTIETDHKNLLWLDTYARANRKLARWRMILMEYTFNIRHVEGKNNIIADVLSRAIQPDQAAINQVQPIDDSLLQEVKLSQQRYKTKEWDTTYKIKQDMYVTKDISEFIVIPSDDHALIHRIIHLAHGDTLTGHMGVNRTLGELAAAGFFWPTMHLDVSKQLDSCLVCQKVRLHKKTITKLLNIAAEQPWYAIMMDHIGPLPETLSGMKYILVMIDVFTRWIELVAVSSTDTEETIKSLMRTFIMRHCVPTRIITDGGTAFENKAFKELTDKYHISHHITTAYHPQSHGTVERVNEEVNRHIRCLTIDFQGERQWDELLPIVQHLINHSVNTSIGTSPYVMFYGSDFARARSGLYALRQGLNEDSIFKRIPNAMTLIGDEGAIGDYTALFQSQLQVVQRQAVKTQQIALRARQQRHEVEGPPSIFDLGEFVLVAPPQDQNRAKFAPLYEGPFKIVDKPSEVLCTILALVDDTRMETIHVSRLRKLELPEDVTHEDLVRLQATDFHEQILTEVTDILPREMDKIMENKDKVRFLCRWAIGDSTWEPHENIHGSKALQIFLSLHPEYVAAFPDHKKRGRPKKVRAVANEDRGSLKKGSVPVDNTEH